MVSFCLHIPSLPSGRCLLQSGACVTVISSVFNVDATSNMIVEHLAILLTFN